MNMNNYYYKAMYSHTYRATKYNEYLSVNFFEEERIFLLGKLTFQVRITKAFSKQQCQLSYKINKKYINFIKSNQTVESVDVCKSNHIFSDFTPHVRY